MVVSRKYVNKVADIKLHREFHGQKSLGTKSEIFFPIKFFPIILGLPYTV